MKRGTYAILVVYAGLVTACNLPGQTTTTSFTKTSSGQAPTATVQSMGSWSTVDSFQLATGVNSGAQMVGTYSSNEVMAVGGGRDSSGGNHWLARATTDGGATWGATDDYLGAGSNSAADGGVLVGANTAYVVGYDRDAGGHTLWATRESTGAAFSTVDSYQYPASTNNAEAFAATVDSSGDVFVTGFAVDAALVQHWVVRKAAAGVWSTSDDYTCADVAGGTSAGGFSAVASGSTVYVGGRCHDGAGLSYWVVRKSTNSGSTWATASVVHEGASGGNGAHLALNPSTGNLYAGGGSDGTMLLRMSSDGGSTWTDVDSFSLGGTNNTEAKGVYITGNGTIYTAGAVNDGVTTHWIVRSNVTGSFTTIDNFTMGGSVAMAMGLVGDASNNVYVAGLATDAGGTQHWLVRKYLTN